MFEVLDEGHRDIIDTGIAIIPTVGLNVVLGVGELTVHLIAEGF